MYTAILDPRIKAAVLSSSLGDYRGYGVELTDDRRYYGDGVVEFWQQYL